MKQGDAVMYPPVFCGFSLVITESSAADDSVINA
jgi:hypothetical protein